MNSEQTPNAAPVHGIVRPFDASQLTGEPGLLVWSHWNPVHTEGDAAITDDGHADDIICMDEDLEWSPVFGLPDASDNRAAARGLDIETEPDGGFGSSHCSARKDP